MKERVKEETKERVEDTTHFETSDKALKEQLMGYGCEIIKVFHKTGKASACPKTYVFKESIADVNSMLAHTPQKKGGG